MELDISLVDALRKMASRGQPPSAMVKFLVERFGVGGRILAVAHFQKAFSLTLSEASILGAWREFPQAAWTEEMLDAALQPLLEATKSLPELPDLPVKS
jgi:hypothetical protein